jgi:hypothetical protein
MAEFLTTADISARLQKIIRESDDRLVLISPYLKTNPRIKELLAQKSQTRTHVRIIYGKRELQPEEQVWIDANPHIELFYRQSLHAKCYLNEKEALLTSMNLYAFSEQNNDEMGIVVSNTSDNWGYDRTLHRKILQEAEHIGDLSEKIREAPKPERAKGLGGLVRRIAKDTLSIAERYTGTDRQAPAEEDGDTVIKVSGGTPNGVDATPYPVSSTTAPIDAQPKLPVTGFCIRCKTHVATNLAEPYCGRCFRIWNQFKNEGFVEKYCHVCEKEHPTIRLKPLCLDCRQIYLEDSVLSAG